MSRAEFVEQTHCINCRSYRLKELSSGLFNESPLHDFIANDPWGESPVPYLKDKRWSYVQCQDCNQAFHRFILSPEWNERRFSNWMSQEAIEQFEKSQKTPARLFQKAQRYTAHVIKIEMLTRCLRNNQAVRILDFGSGYGEFLAMCSLYGFEAYGVDRSSARRNNSRYSGIFTDLDELKSSDAGSKKFHCITLFEVLEHLDHPRAVLDALTEFLVAGGIFVLETPDCSGVTTIATKADYLKIHPLEHINGFTPQTLTSIIERLGFVQIRSPEVHVTGDPWRVIKTEIKKAIAGFRSPATQQYFRKL